jgi:exopolysaccharide biosynthesis polyprenyl glycosylphosphotransferase
MSTATLKRPPLTATETERAAHREPRAPQAGSRPSRRHEWGLFVGALAALDSVALTGAFSVAYVVRFTAGIPLLETPPGTLSFYSSVAFWSIPAWLLLFAVYGLYKPGMQTDIGRIASACTTGLVVEVMFSFIDTTLLISRGWLLLTWVLSIAFVCIVRSGANQALRQLRRHGILCSRTVIVGTNEEALSIADQLLADPGDGIRLVGFVDADHPVGTFVHAGLTIIDCFERLRQTLREQQVSDVIVASTAVSGEQLLDLYRSLGGDPAIHLRLSSGLWEILTTGVRVEGVNRVPLITPERVRITGLDALMKTCIDYVIATMALVALSPLLLAIATLIRLDSPGPVIYRRRVLGVSGAPFDAFKFRTMIEGAERRRKQAPIAFPDRRSLFKSTRDPRITRVGRFLRKASLDELPQLVNVLRGEMSLVGPRMIAPDEQTLYGRWQLNLLTVKPGITGPWQVQGRGDIPYAERVRLSMQYVRNYSLWLDLEILLRTCLVVLRGRGAY